MKLLDRVTTTLDALTSESPRSEDLNLWPGWGMLAPIFDTRTERAPSHEKIYDVLCDRLKPRVLEAGSQVCHTSFYTPSWLVDSVFNLLAAADITQGRFLDLGTGTGRFLDGSPSDVTWTAVEKDPLSARIAALRHPEATIIKRDLSSTTLAEESYQAVVGNIPFSSAMSYMRYPRYQGSVTGMFVHAAAACLAPGGLAVLIAPVGVVDRWESYCPQNAALVGAVRLPSGTFEGTATSADVLVMARRSEVSTHIDAQARAQETYGDIGSLSALWNHHPEWVAGTLENSGSYQMPLRVASTDPRADTISALTHLRAEVARCIINVQSDSLTSPAVMTHSPAGEMVGSFVYRGDQIVQIAPDGSDLAVRVSAELRALVSLRDLVVDLMDAEASRETPDAEIAPLRERTHEAWQSYVHRYGAINRGTLHEGAIDPETGIAKLSWRRPLLGGFRKDPRAFLVMAIEHYEPETGEVSPAPILLHRVNVEAPKPVHADSLEQAITISLSETRALDLGRIAELVHLPVAEVESALVERGLIFFDPEQNKLLSRRDYLCGHIPTKIDHARRAGLSRNVSELEAIMPPRIEAIDLDVRLGITWIGQSVVDQFVHDALGLHGTVEHEPITSTWDVRVYGRPKADILARCSTDRMSIEQLLRAALNGRAPVVYDEDYDSRTGTTKRRRNAGATLAALEASAALEAEFRLWLWSDAERTEKMLETYHRKFGGYVRRSHDGSSLRLSGLSPDVSLWKHQVDMVDFSLSVPRALCAHTVGAGKTRTAIATAMTARDCGVANRPLLAVPGHLLDQTARECQQTYPAARILVATKDDLAGDARRLFAARCISMNPDLIVMSHESFGALPLSAESEARLVSDQLADLSTRVTVNSSLGGGGRSPKTIAKMLETMRAKMQMLRGKGGDAASMTFDQLGVDYVIVDEAHLYRRHGAAATRTEGFSLGASQRATDLSLKLDYLALRYGANRPHAMMMTGTPFVNSLAETFVWLYYLMPQRLRDMGIENFDAFAATFIEYTTRAEVAPDGSGFRLNTRPTAVTNAPELMSLLDNVAHFVTSDDLDLPRPRVTYHEVVSQRSVKQTEIMDDIVARSADLARGVGRQGDNMLVICGDGRKVALDPMLLEPRGGSSPKITKAAREIEKVYRRHPEALQLVCCDMGTPKPGEQTSYDRLRAALIKRGIPAQRVRFVHEATTDKQREALFASCRNGEVSVIVGSTPKIGTGTNIQTRMKAIHHLDPAWNPASMQQREGRGIRFGNMYDEVEVYRHITENTFDAFMWQTLVRKATFVSALMSQSNVAKRARRVEDVADIVLDYSSVLAAASGNPLLAQRAEVAMEVRRLEVLSSMFAGRKLTLGRRCNSLRSDIARAEGIRRSLRALDSASFTDADLMAACVHMAGQLHHGRGAWHDEDAGDLELHYKEVQSRSVIVVRERSHSDGVEVDIPRGIHRRGTVDTLVDHVLTGVRHELSMVPERISRSEEMAQAWARELADFESTLETMVFDRSDELTTARARLIAIDREISASIEQEDEAA